MLFQLLTKCKTGKTLLGSINVSWKDISAYDKHPRADWNTQRLSTWRAGQSYLFRIQQYPVNTTYNKCCWYILLNVGLG